MKILITYASAGSGHRQAAEAIYNYFKENCPSCGLKITDTLEESNSPFKNIYSYGYLFLVNHALWLWRIGFWLTYIKCLRALNKILIFIINRLNTKNFAKFLIQENPDFIIATHFLPLEISAYLKKNHRISSKLIGVITDFGIHPFWIQEAVDVYVVASDFTKEQLLLEGIKETNIREFGIPIHAKFLKIYEKDILCRKFGLNQNKFTVLITTGSFGMGPIEEITDLLYNDVQILVICANNKRLYARLKNRNYPNVSVFGFVDYAQELMAVSDMIITKPGGLTISESLAMELVPIFISPIPGQETQNLKALEKHGVGYRPKVLKDIKDTVLDYKEQPDKLNNMKNNIKAIKKPNVLRELCNVICASRIGFTDRGAV